MERDEEHYTDNLYYTDKDRKQTKELEDELLKDYKVQNRQILAEDEWMFPNKNTLNHTNNNNNNNNNNTNNNNAFSAKDLCQVDIPQQNWYTLHPEPLFYTRSRVFQIHNIISPQISSLLLQESNLIHNSHLKSSSTLHHPEGLHLLSCPEFRSLSKHISQKIASISSHLFPSHITNSQIYVSSMYILHYSASSSSEFKHHPLHTDESSFSLNICIGKTSDLKGGELYFVDQLSGAKTLTLPHEIGTGIIHWGKLYHGANPVVSGERWNLIVWFKRSNQEFTCFNNGVPIEIQIEIMNYMTEKELVYLSMTNKFFNALVHRNQFVNDLFWTKIQGLKTKLASADRLKAIKMTRLLSKEFLDTEKTYIDMLQETVTLFKNPMLEQRLISVQESNDIFSNIETLVAVHKEFEIDLKRAAELSEETGVFRVGGILEKYAPYWNMYRTTIRNYNENAIRVLNGKKEDKKVAKFLQEQKVKFRGMDLESGLVAPMRRLPRYALLVRELVRYGGEEEEKLAENGVERLNGVLVSLNEQNKEEEKKNVNKK